MLQWEFVVKISRNDYNGGERKVRKSIESRQDKIMAAADMTRGSMVRHLVRYSVPLILGNIFQLTYNAVDSMIAGRFIGKEALAAEGMAGPVMNLMILGISGICMGAGVLMSEFYGAGKTETLRAIAGVDPLLTGKVYLFGADVSGENSIRRLEKGLVYAPEDRRRLGLVMQMSVQQNVSLGNESKYAEGMFIQEKREVSGVEQAVDRMLVRTASLETPVSVLSGGNQQKVILARCLEREAKIFLMDEPTVGIDVGARAEIYQLISNIVKEDAAVLIASSDLNEILEVCDRVAIIANGRIAAVMDREEMIQEKMLLYAMGDKE